MLDRPLVLRFIPELDLFFFTGSFRFLQEEGGLRKRKKRIDSVVFLSPGLLEGDGSGGSDEAGGPDHAGGAHEAGEGGGGGGDGGGGQGHGRQGGLQG